MGGTHCQQSYRECFVHLEDSDFLHGLESQHNYLLRRRNVVIHPVGDNQLEVGRSFDVFLVDLEKGGEKRILSFGQSTVQSKQFLTLLERRFSGHIHDPTNLDPLDTKLAQFRGCIPGIR